MITIICSTNRPGSNSLALSKYYQSMLLSLGTESHIIDLAQLPDNFVASALYHNAGKDPDFNPFRERMANSEKMVFIVPEYNGSFPGVLKAFIDGLEYPNSFRNKKCAMVGLSSGAQGGGLALSHLTDIFNYCGMHVMAQKPKLARFESNFQNGAFTNERYERMLKEQAQAIIEF